MMSNNEDLQKRVNSFVAAVIVITFMALVTKPFFNALDYEASHDWSYSIIRVEDK